MALWQSKFALTSTKRCDSILPNLRTFTQQSEFANSSVSDPNLRYLHEAIRICTKWSAMTFPVIFLWVLSNMQIECVTPQVEVKDRCCIAWQSMRLIMRKIVHLHPKCANNRRFCWKTYENRMQFTHPFLPSISI